MRIGELWKASVRGRWFIGVLGGTVLLWEVLVWLFQPAIFILPPPSAVIQEFWVSPLVFLKHTVFTVSVTLIAFGFAVVVGVLLAIGIVYSAVVERTLYTLLIALNSIPKVALAPLFVIWLGTDAAPKVAIAFTIAIFSIVIDTVMGLRSVDPDVLDLAKAGRASHMQVLLKLRLPTALPNLFAGMKVAISFALVGTIVGEFVAGTVGLGHLILLSQGNFNTPRVFAAIVILGIVGTILFYLVDIAERFLLPWHVSHRAAAAPTEHRI